MIHIDHAKNGQSTCPTVCSRSRVNERQHVQTIKHSETHSSFERYSSLHSNCASPVRLESLVHLTRVCRQIHQEAALLPFADNEFSFSSMIALETFLKAIVPSQARALQTILVVLGDFSDRGGGAQLTRFFNGRLHSLHNLIILLEVHTPWHSLDFVNVADSKARRSHLILQFSHLPLDSVSVVTYMTRYEPFYGRVPVEGVRSWEERIEQQLMTPWDGQNAREERMKKSAARNAAAAAQMEANRQRTVTNRSAGRLRALEGN